MYLSNTMMNKNAKKPIAAPKAELSAPMFRLDEDTILGRSVECVDPVTKKVIIEYDSAKEATRAIVDGCNANGLGIEDVDKMLRKVYWAIKKGDKLAGYLWRWGKRI